MANKEKLQKKLPKRAAKSHPKHVKRMGHKARAQIRHDANRLAQDNRERLNITLREAGLKTGWEISKMVRASKRHPE